MLKKICNISDCTSCLSCYNACSHDAIVIKEDRYHFKFPLIDTNKCVNCNLCHKSCPVLNPIKLYDTPLSCFAAYSKSLDDKLSSSSGGVSSVLNNWIVSNGGVAYGCVMESAAQIEHQRVSKVEELVKFKKSKYVQSDIGKIYKNVKADLNEGLQVIFTGTPCQIAGLYKFLRKRYDNLTTVDLVCHGVPSQGLLQECVKTALKNAGINKKISDVRVSTRGKKEDGIYIYFLSIACENKVIYENENDPYILAFLDGLTFRESCYNCKYATSRRVSDITICDFWGLGKIQEENFDKERGVSGVMLNTKKGVELFESCSNEMECIERNSFELISGNGQLKKAFRRTRPRNFFLKNYGTGMDFANIVSDSIKIQTDFQNRCRRIHHFHLLKFYLFIDKIINHFYNDKKYYSKHFKIVK